MSLANVHSKLSELRSISGKGSVAKKKLLISGFIQKDELFKDVLLMALSSTKTYGIEDLGVYRETKGSRDPRKILDYLNRLSMSKGTTDKEKAMLQRMAGQDKETFDVVRRITMNNLGIDMGAKLINEAIGYMLIYAVPYMRCHTTEKHGHKIIFPAFAQVKEDGAFLNGFINPKEKIFKFETREGNPVRQLTHLLTKLAKYKRPRVNAGEILVLDGNGDPLPREAGNGIINQCLQNCADPADVARIVYRVWDSVNFDEFWAGHSPVAYVNRYMDVTKMCCSFEDKRLIKSVETKVVHNWNQIDDFYINVRSRDPKKEGIVVKNLRGEFKDHTSSDQQKVVNVSRGELRILGWDYGEKHKKHEHSLGRLHLGTDDGLLEVSIGQFPDDFRNQSIEDLDDLVGRICGVKYKSVEKAVKNTKASLYLPRYDGIRYDRNDTDTLDDLLNR